VNYEFFSELLMRARPLNTLSNQDIEWVVCRAIAGVFGCCREEE